MRRALARGQSVRYLVPDAALEEIYASGLYGAARPSRPLPTPHLLFLVPPPKARKAAEEEGGQAKGGEEVSNDRTYSQNSSTR